MSRDESILQSVTNNRAYESLLMNTKRKRETERRP
jgi:hypothetical protein